MGPDRATSGVVAPASEQPQRGGLLAASQRPGGLLGRDGQLARLDELIDAAARGRGAVALIEGPAGIGKSALLHAACALGEHGGLRVLFARGGELEQEFTHGVSRQLFEALVRHAPATERERLLSGAAALARPLFAGHADGGAASARAPDRGFALVHGLYWLAVNIAEEGPLLLALDDAQWADAPSLVFLAYLGARCRELPVALAIASRSGEASANAPLLDRVRAAPHTEPLALEPLGHQALAALMARRLGQEPAPSFLAACARACGGNPFLAQELAAELRRMGMAPRAENAPRVAQVRPAAITRAVLARLSSLGEAEGRVARAVAVLERAWPGQAAELAELALDAARACADRLIDAGILAREPELGFSHPLLRAAVYESIPPAARAAAHLRAGLLADDAGAASAAVCSHLLRGERGGRARVVALLRAGARAALDQGDPPSAVRLLERALQEPPAPELQAEVLAELGEAQALAREPGAVESLARALELIAAPARPRVACVLAEALIWSGQVARAHAVLGQVLEGLPAQGGPGARVALETMRAAAASLTRELVGEVAPRLDELRRLARAAGAEGRALLIFEGCWRAQRGRYREGWRRLLDEGLDGGRFVAEHGTGWAIVTYAAPVLALSDEPERARALLADIRADAARRGSIHTHVSALAWEALVALRCGEVAAAQADSELAVELAVRHRLQWVAAWCSATLAQALLERGRLEQAEAALSRAPVQGALGSAAGLHLLLARGRLRLAQGRLEEAAVELRATGEAVIVNNPSYVPWRSLLALALAPSRPRAAHALAQAELARARELGQPRGVGVALRVWGALARDTAALEEAVATLRDSPARLELARALCELGRVLRQTGSRGAAREPLREALALAQACSAEALEARASAELAASGARLRRERQAGPEALTPSERRVAELAAAGYSNREIAQSLFVTVKTVGTHLGHAYQKLDLTGPQARELLAERLQASAHRA